MAISPSTWHRLVEANKEASWAGPGVFATGIGPDYPPASGEGLLYIGKSAGPLNKDVGFTYQREANLRASQNWMVERRNPTSSFWRFIETIDRTRCSLAWTNVCKMDRRGGDRPPRRHEWNQVSDVCLKALTEEITSLAPRVVLFATSLDYHADIVRVLTSLGYSPRPVDFDDGWTARFQIERGASAIMTKHPQGWRSTDRAGVLGLIGQLLRA